MTEEEGPEWEMELEGGTKEERRITRRRVSGLKETERGSDEDREQQQRCEWME